MKLFDKASAGFSKMAGSIGTSAKELADWAETMPDKLKEMSKDFDAESLREKLTKTAAKAGQELIVMVMTIYNSIESLITKTRHDADNLVNNQDNKFLDITVLLGAIVYFVTPADVIPDIVPIGFIDDSALLTLAFNKAKKMFSEADIAKANETASKLLGDNFDTAKAEKMAKAIITATR